MKSSGRTGPCHCSVKHIQENCFLNLERKGYVLEEKYPGIYYVSGNILFPVQIVVISRLNRTMHSSLRILSANADIEDIRKFLEQTENMKTPRERNNIDAVLQASVSANYEIYQKVRRGEWYVRSITGINER